MGTRERLRALHDANAEMIRSLDLEHRVQSAVRSARKLVPADAAAILLPDDAGDVLVVRAHEGLSERYASGLRIPLAAARADYRAAGEHVVIDLLADPRGDRKLVKAEGLAKVLSIPLFGVDELIGALGIYTRDRARVFDADDIEVAHILASTIAIGITNARLYAQAVQQRELQQELFDALGDGVLFGWPDGRLEANTRALEILGVPRLDSVARLRAAVEFRDPTSERTPVAETPLDRALRGESTHAEYVARQLETGSERDVHVSTAPAHGANGAVSAAVMIVHDTGDARIADREREQFLSIVSHELRTPLTPLKALAQLVRGRMRRSRQEGRALDLESLDRNLATIERQVDRMNGLVNDLLSVSRAERGSLRMEPVAFDLAGLVRDVVQRYVDATAEEGRHHFKIEAPPSVPAHGDESRIEQLLMNLVGNAVKYSPTGGEVRVAVRRENGAAEIAVSDDGIGIPAEDLPKLAHPFVRGGGRAGTFAGMGVGLYVARIVAEAHAGSLALESEGDNKGTTVRVKLPL
jgi:signal transduction histidine kinase